MKVRDIMRPHVITADSSDPASQVGIRLVVGRISGMPITKDKTLVGMATEFDLVRALRAGTDLDNTPIRDLMTKDVISVDSDTLIEEVMEILERERIIRVPVTSNGKLVGMVSRGDVLESALRPLQDINA